MTYPKLLESVVKIRFSDCDPFGHLHNTRYLDYMQNTRFDQVEEAYDYQTFMPDNYNWMSTKNQIVYLAPAVMDERVLIQTRLIDATHRALTVEAIMLNQDATKLKAVLWMEFMYMQLEPVRPARHSEELMALFEQIRWREDTLNLNDFDGRVRELRAQLRETRRSQEV
jgi:thioesterase-3